MNELPTLPEQNPAPAPVPAPAAPQAEESFTELLQRPLSKVAIALLLLIAALAWSTHTRFGHLRQEMARSLQKGEATNNETIALARQVSEQNKELQAKVAALESRQSEAQSQQVALEALYQDLSKNRDEWALAEIEQVLSTASQQLQLAGNVQGALIALANADRSLSRSDKPQFITIRRAIARDTDKLKALPGIDVAGLALRIDSVIGEIDALPMLSDSKPVAPSQLAKARVKPVTKPGAPAPDGFGARLQNVWTSWTGEMWDEVRQLIRVRSVDTPEALMLSPSESYFTRENLKLRLLNARLALLSRNEAAFRSDLANAQDTLTKYFDTRARSTQSAQAALRQVQGNNLAIDMPTLADSLNAVRTYKAKP
ncbi:uroporphyrinogen-III C-methyltransferase [Massilia sp. R2A-15]|uniref:uroporphyrinogen-III C-methyltransferase n=1 Tax=Massilia sp. R2A-15 TaxID=3064278 RepID=UPI002734EC64|nr:uroporphyrinogen-III C-methyltransferase [Massilia sp. R2A-15]WLI90511.1 uroporphyrinogen-III C-methyltransferase [Massilia sp. R2A-15]